MQPKSLTDSISVAAQIDADDMVELAAVAAQHGLAYRYVPVASGQLADADVDAFVQVLATLPPPVLAFCRTGTRSTMLWALQASRSQSVEDVARIAAAAGYDLDALRARLQVQHDRYTIRAESCDGTGRTV